MEADGFTPEAKAREYPHLWGDELQIEQHSSYPQERLEELNEQYIEFITDPTSFPPHVERAVAIHRHIAFELGWRVVQKLSELGSGKAE